MKSRRVNVRRKISLIVLVIIPLIALNAYLITFKFMRSATTEKDCRASSSNLQREDFASCWSKAINKDGLESAAKDFVRWNYRFIPGVQHTNAHAFGGLLFAVNGKEGLRYCTPDFAFGCYHEFLGKAISKLGFGVTAELNESCFKYNSVNPLSCQHGIGHGLVAAAGYDEPSLKKALDNCRGLSHGDPIGGCFGGIFMEYFLRTMNSLDGAPVRPMADNKFDECGSLDDVYRIACYYWQPQWWISLSRPNMERLDDRAKQMGKWCASVPEKYHEQCYRGIGNYTGSEVGYDPIKAIAFCTSVAESLRGEHAPLVWCLDDTANSFATIPEFSDKAKEVCSPLPGRENVDCLKRARDLGASMKE